MKYKRLTKEQIIISLDRLTRFKPTREKYLRVFFDIILSNLIEPKIKRAELEKMSFAQIRDWAVEIFNASVSEETNSLPLNLPSNLPPKIPPYLPPINEKLRDYENSIYNNDSSTKELLENQIDYENALQYIDEDCVVNLKWLKSLSSNQNLAENRELHCLKYPIEKVLLVEGLTEEILLPAFSRYLGFDFYQKGIQVIPAGGKNQVVRMYYKLSEELKLPIFLLLDKDAEENIAQIKPKLRNIDKIHLVSCGEFEDLLPKSLIIKTVNLHFENFLSIGEEDLALDLPNAKILENIFKTKGLHEFKKAEFAKLIKSNITQDSDISREIADIVKEISETNKTLDTNFCS